MQGVCSEFAAVQPRDMAGVNASLHSLEVIVLLNAFAYIAMRIGDRSPLVLRQWGLQIGRTHVSPNHATPLKARVCIQLDSFAQFAGFGLGWNFYALACDVKLPAVVRTANAPFFIAAKPKRHASMCTKLIQQTHLAA